MYAGLLNILFEGLVSGDKTAPIGVIAFRKTGGAFGVDIKRQRQITYY